MQFSIGGANNVQQPLKEDKLWFPPGMTSPGPLTIVLVESRIKQLVEPQKTETVDGQKTH